MKFICNFLNPDTAERKTITAALSAAQVTAIDGMRAANDVSADVQAEAMALRSAYAEVPEGFRHTAPPALISLN